MSGSKRGGDNVISRPSALLAVGFSARKIWVVIVGGRSECFTGGAAGTGDSVYPYVAGGKAGGPGGVRTHDPWVKSPLLFR